MTTRKGSNTGSRLQSRSSSSMSLSSMSSQSSSRGSSNKAKLRRSSSAADVVTPGPASYSTPNVFGKDRTRASVPSFSMGRRFTLPKVLETPAPQYVDAKMSRHGPSHTPHATLTGRPKDRSPEATPGPYATSNARLRRASSAVMVFRPKEPKTLVTPGPNSYDASNSDRQNSKFKSSPRSIMSSKPRVSVSVTPGPSDYKTEKKPSIKRSPSFTMGSRYHSSEPEATPGPASYSTEKSTTVMKKRSPSFAMGVKYSDRVIPLQH